MSLKCAKPRRTPPCLQTLVTVALSLAASGWPWASILAQESADDSGAVLEEVRVTATRRSATVFDIPQSIRAFSEEELQRLGADSLQDYAEFTPGMSLIDQGHRNRRFCI